MNRYEISYEFRERFITENRKVWRSSVKATYFAINGEEVLPSINPYLMEDSEHGLVIFTYTYIVITNTDCSMVPLFFSSDGTIEDYIIIDDWKFYFSEPMTGMFRRYYTAVYMEKENLSCSVNVENG